MLGTKIGFDLGTTTIAANVDGKGIKINEPSVIVYDCFEEKVKAIGKEAYKMLGKTPDYLTAIRPIIDGDIYDYGALEQMLCYFIQKICGNRILKPSIIACVPSETNEIDKKTVTDLLISSGAARACVIEEPLAAALGAGVPVLDEVRAGKDLLAVGADVLAGRAGGAVRVQVPALSAVDLRVGGLHQRIHGVARKETHRITPYPGP